MTWTEILIIYLACGSPFAVYKATQVGRPFSFGHLNRMLAAFLAWPILAVRALLDRVSTDRDALNGSLDLQIKETRKAMEELAFGTTGADRGLAEFRDLFDRYAGLARAVQSEGEPPRELFEISGHAKPEVAGRVVARRNREKLLFHQANARNDFVDLVAELALRGDGVVRLASDLADTLGDADAVADLSALFPQDKPDRSKRSSSAVVSVR